MLCKDMLSCREVYVYWTRVWRCMLGSLLKTFNLRVYLCTQQRVYRTRAPQISPIWRGCFNHWPWWFKVVGDCLFLAHVSVRSTQMSCSCISRLTNFRSEVSQKAGVIKVGVQCSVVGRQLCRFGSTPLAGRSHTCSSTYWARKWRVTSTIPPFLRTWSGGSPTKTRCTTTTPASRAAYFTPLQSCCTTTSLHCSTASVGSGRRRWWWTPTGRRSTSHRSGGGGGVARRWLYTLRATRKRCNRFLSLGPWRACISCPWRSSVRRRITGSSHGLRDTDTGALRYNERFGITKNRSLYQRFVVSRFAWLARSVSGVHNQFVISKLTSKPRYHKSIGSTWKISPLRGCVMQSRVSLMAVGISKQLCVPSLLRVRDAVASF